MKTRMNVRGKERRVPFRLYRLFARTLRHSRRLETDAAVALGYR
jgi:hypothetical protein